MSPPPFRAEHIGSLLRPPELLKMRQDFADGLVDEGTLHEAEDKAVRDAIALQKSVGLKMVTDGEFRRHAYNDFFYGHLGDIAIEAPDVDKDDAKEGAKRASQPMSIIKSRLKWTAPIHAGEYRFLAKNSESVGKITLPGPCVLHFRGGTQAVTRFGAYDDVATFWSDTIDAFNSELASLAEAGCTYVQIDETAFAKFGDPDVQKALAERGDNWETLIDEYIEVTNRILDLAPKGMNIGMHLCRGNRGGHFHAEGSYDVVAEKLFNALNIRFYFMEYDSPRAGDFSPLRFLPAHKSVVLGLISTKSPALEDLDALKRRIDAAAQFVDMERLAVSPQCGFASVETGNPISPDDQKRKLGLVVSLAHDQWGES